MTAGVTAGVSVASATSSCGEGMWEIEVEFGDGGQDGQGRGVSVDAPYLWNVRTLVPGIFWEAMSVLTGD